MAASLGNGRLLPDAGRVMVIIPSKMPAQAPFKGARPLHRRVRSFGNDFVGERSAFGDEMEPALDNGG
jgi:hypothetical protein